MCELHHRFVFGGRSQWLFKLWSRVLSGLFGFKFMYPVRGWVVLFIDGSIRSFWGLYCGHLLHCGCERLHKLRRWNISSKHKFDLMLDMRGRIIPSNLWGKLIFELHELYCG